jgi:hypothetical protein
MGWCSRVAAGSVIGDIGGSLGGGSVSGLAVLMTRLPRAAARCRTVSRNRIKPANATTAKLSAREFSYRRTANARSRTTTGCGEVECSMTVIVSVKINEGIVMAADSTSTFANTQVYDHAEKIANLIKGLPIGVMVTGDGGIGSESLTTLLKDLGKRLGDKQDSMYLDPTSYTMAAVAHRLHDFLFMEKSIPSGRTANILLRVCGYSAGRPLPEVWQVQLQGAISYEILLVHPEGDFGVNWDGQYDALNRLILGAPTNFEQIAVDWGMQRSDADSLGSAVRRSAQETLVIPTMPIQDAIDLARYLVEVAIGFTKFSIMKQPKTVGGVIDIAAITKHEGFRWVQRKQFYSPELND